VTTQETYKKIIARVGRRQKGRFPHGRRSVGEPELYFHSGDNFWLTKTPFITFFEILHSQSPTELTAIRMP
jgi:hypothetical protein